MSYLPEHNDGSEEVRSSRDTLTSLLNDASRPYRKKAEEAVLKAVKGFTERLISSSFNMALASLGTTFLTVIEL